MTEIAYCKGCLASKGLTFIEENSGFRTTYLKITNCHSIKLQYLCHDCIHMLQRCQRFIDKCNTAERLLLNLCVNNQEINTNLLHLIDRNYHKLSANLTIVHVDKHDYLPISTDDKTYIHVKEEVTERDRETVTEEDGGRDDFNHDIIEFETQDTKDSDLEDDLPLKLLSVKKKKNKDKKTEGESVNFIEITLTKEQQMSELSERLTSMNYIYSPYKCTECYKGFVDGNAYNNHLDQHSEARGDYQCEICKLRYSSSRQLKSHKVASHYRRFQCLLCQHRALTAHQAREHQKWHNGYKYNCDICGANFRKSTSRLSHMRKSHASKYNCTLCGESFFTKYGLVMHKAKVHAHKQVEVEDAVPPSDRYCNECNIQFVSMVAYNRHIDRCTVHLDLQRRKRSRCKNCGLDRVNCPLTCQRKKPETNIGQPMLVCTKCPASFPTRSRLTAHERRTHLKLNKSRRIVCETCGNEFASNASLTYHQRTHTGERPYACAECPSRFPDRNQLRIHSRTHTGEKPYTCEQCGKKFRQKPSLNRHMRVHTGVKPYVCQYCLKSFSQSNSMKIHVRTVHLKLPDKRSKKKAPTQRSDAKNKADEVVIQNL